jgi:3-oxoacyl-[acyl-carrier protein] reductase
MQSPVLILGAGGAIGGAIARRLAPERLIVAHARAPGGALDAWAGAAKVEAVHADLASAPAVEALFAGLARRHPALSGLVHAAGRPFANRLAHRTGWDAFREQIEIELESLHRILVLALPLLRAEEGGARVVLVGSEFTLGAPPPKAAPYIAAKYAMTGYARVLAQEWLAYGVRVHIVAPGMLRSGMTVGMPDDYLSGVEAQMPEKRLTSADDVAQVAAMLLTPSGDTLYGTVVPVTRAARR